LTAFGGGALRGAGAALLLATRSGAQTQEEIRAGVRRVRTAAEDRVESARLKVNRTRTRIEDQLGTVKDRIDTKADRAREALDSGRRVARDARSELEKRVADVRDSSQSIRERFSRGGQTNDFGNREAHDDQMSDSVPPVAGTTESAQDLTGGNPDLI
jgi:gas vesicle protein